MIDYYTLYFLYKEHSLRRCSVDFAGICSELENATQVYLSGNLEDTISNVA